MIREKVFGKKHPDTANSYSNIGLVMQAMGDIVGLAIYLKVFGKEHPHTANSYNNIGLVMQAMGDNVGVLEMYNKGLTIREKVLRKQHPDTIISSNAVASNLQNYGWHGIIQSKSWTIFYKCPKILCENIFFPAKYYYKMKLSHSRGLLLPCYVVRLFVERMTIWSLTIACEIQ